jgi:branched-chain amino acid transport system permease protein
MGIPGIPLPSIGGVMITGNAGFYYLGCTLLILCFLFCTQVTRSFVGRAWMAIAEDETAAGAMGISPFRYKLLAFGLSSMIGGIAGSYLAVFTRFISPANFTVDQSVLLIVMLVIGGLGNLIGSVVGAAVMIGATELLRPIPELRIASIGLLMILIPVFRPQGLFRDLVLNLESLLRRATGQSSLIRNVLR